MVVCKARHRLLFLVVLTLFPCRLVAYGGWRLVSLTVYALVFGGGAKWSDGRAAGRSHRDGYFWINGVWKFGCALSLGVLESIG
jgi:hypothetical protein